MRACNVMGLISVRRGGFSPTSRLWYGLVGVLLVILPLSGAARAANDSADERIRVMSFNIWVGGEEGGQPLEQTAEVIRAAEADIVGMQESLGRERNGERPDSGAKIAKLLGWHHVNQEGGRAILSRFEIIGLTPGKEGARLKLPSGQSFYLFNVHLNHAPYQPYQLLEIPYEDAPFLNTAEELVQAATAARGEEVAAVLSEVKPILSKNEAVALTGDFNEPSHQDWTARAADKGVAPLKVPYPSTSAVTATGLVDAYRAAHPDEVSHRGLTWTPTTNESDPTDRHDRIDMIFVSPGVAVEACVIVGEDERYADIVVSPYPSDHRAVVAEIVLP